MKHAKLVHLFGLCLLTVSLTLWIATGREGYTRWPNQKLAASDTPHSDQELNLLDEIGLDSDEERSELPNIESKFAFGLVPGGFSPAHLISVATALLLAIAISGGVVLMSAHQRAKQRRSDSQQPQT